MKILRSPGHYTAAETQSLEWLGQQAKWLTVRVQRKSPREFDLHIEGEYDADDGYDYLPIGEAQIGIGSRRIEGVRHQRVRRKTPKVKPQRFSAWLPLAALREFWTLGWHQPLHGDWSFTRDMLEPAIWAEFHRVVELARSKPLFSKTFMQAADSVWRMLGEDGGHFAENGDAVESVLDRLDMLCDADGVKAVAELKWLDEQFGPQRVAKELEGLVAWVA